ncbi:MAG: SUMF1/EgtB/PvdO family nonheme iron enzyme [Treponema sp.]|jgi:formylglycine-generating enzyme required for sulfatase activity|nr:SUMF1/EgtB/PvdO family nonheme iron enzyme [Treponema sp.]
MTIKGNGPGWRGVMLVWLALGTLAPLVAQDRRGIEVILADAVGKDATVGRQWAVFIAIDRYQEWKPLCNPVKDAREIRDILTERYFIDEVKELYDREATAANIRRLFAELRQKAGVNDSVFVFYAGHGHTDDMTNTGFWIPADAGNDVFAQANWLPNIQVRNMLAALPAKHVFLVSDACFSGDILDTNRGAVPQIDSEYFKRAYSRVSRQVMTSGASENVPDTSEFAMRLKSTLTRAEGLCIDPEYLFNNVREVRSTQPLLGVIRGTEHQDGGSFLFFRRPVVQMVQPKPGTRQPAPQWGEEVIETGSLTVSTVTAGALEIRQGSEVIGSRSISAGARLPINNLAVGTYTVRIRYSRGRTEEKTVTVRKDGAVAAAFDYQPPAAAPGPALTPQPAVPSQQTPGSRPPERPVPDGFVRINGGTFMMGSPASEAERHSSEVQHQVTVSGFFMGKYEVTQKEYQAVMGSNPSEFKGDNLPVEQVSWFDAVEYCNARSRKEGLTLAYTISGSGDSRTVTWNRNATGYRLPTEAEWEYACRAGTTTPFSTGSNITTNQANYHGNYPYNGNATGTYREKTTAVGSFAANVWGLYDMHGNVWEWCWDWYGNYGSGSQTDPVGASSGTRRVGRGGCWGGDGLSLRSAWRSDGTPSARVSILGFRLARPSL